MLRSRTSRYALLTLVVAVVAAASIVPAASAAALRYASPTGSGNACSSASPCDITQAISGAGSGDEVIVNPGDYPLAATLGVPALITILGVAGRPRPRLLFSGGNQGGVSLSHDSMLRYLEIDQATPWTLALFSNGATVDQVVLKGSAGESCTAHINSSTIRNSIVVAPGSGASAICTGTLPGTIASAYRNVTAVATGSGGVAIEAMALGSSQKATVNLVNVIAKGGPGGAGLAMRTDSGGAEATITATHTNFANYWTSGTNAQFIDGGGNQGAPPGFVNPAAGDYRQASGSVTIDAGLDEPINGAFDVDGDPRRIGATDIGADELVVAPTATTGAASAVADQSATLSGSVDANGAPTSYHFEYGPTTAHGVTTTATGAGSGTGAVAAAATLGGLSPATTYHYRLVASNAGGVTKGVDQTFTTAAPAVTSSTATSTTATAGPTLGFAGVRLVSTRLSLARGFVTLGLRCPAGTVGRCSGRTKLTARRRRKSSRAATTVVVGRATFSIAAGKQARVRVRVTRAGRRLLNRTPRLRGRAANAARDGAGQSKTTVAAVTIRRRHR